MQKGITRIKKEKWFDPQGDTGWSKKLPPDERRALMLKAHGGDQLAAGRALLALHNVTKDRETKNYARQDAEYFFRMHRKNRRIGYKCHPKNIISPRQRPISPRTRRLD